MGINQNYINHVAIIADASSSMYHLRDELVKVIDAQVKHLAQRSTELDQETRVTFYVFNQVVECLVYDKDVLRLPSIKSLYRPQGRTALMDATHRGIGDLQQTAQLYGDHAFLVYVLTDGQENESHLVTAQKLNATLNGLPENWTVAALVPNVSGKFEAKKVGFPADNIAIWDATSVEGMVEAGGTIRRATDQFMTNRESGIRGTRSVFSMDPGNLNSSNIFKAGLRPLEADEFSLFDVGPATQEIKPFVLSHGINYRLGIAYYQLTKTETIQKGKQVAVHQKSTGQVFTGQHARDLLKLPDDATRVTPGYNPDFDVFVQSTSVNRKLLPGTSLLVTR